MKILTRILIVAALLSGGAAVSRAETVSQREAKAVAEQFFNAAHGRVMASPRYVYNGRRLTTGSYFAPFYVYNHPTGGFVVISAENKAFPILGFSLTDTFSPDHIGDNLRALLTMYARHIENVRYDSDIPYEAIEAWRNLPEYIDATLKARYEATDPRIAPTEAMQELERLLDSDDYAASASATYSPDQWEDLLAAELKVKPDVPLGIVSGEAVFPAVVYGRKGHMYRIMLDGRDNALWRLMPTEILSQGQLAVLGNPPAVAEPEDEDVPFEFYDSFVAAVDAERRAYRTEIENPGVGYTPAVLWHGSGHFTVTLPEQVLSMRVYSLDGQLVQRNTFRETNVANIELTQNPTGFYFAVFFGASGRPYSVKLFR